MHVQYKKLHENPLNLTLGIFSMNGKVDPIVNPGRRKYNPSTLVGSSVITVICHIAIVVQIWFIDF